MRTNSYYLIQGFLIFALVSSRLTAVPEIQMKLTQVFIVLALAARFLDDAQTKPTASRTRFLKVCEVSLIVVGVSAFAFASFEVFATL